MPPGVSLKNDGSQFHHVSAASELERHSGILFNENDSNPLPVNADYDPANFTHHNGRRPTPPFSTSSILSLQSVVLTDFFLEYLPLWALGQLFPEVDGLRFLKTRQVLSAEFNYLGF
jgi:hypothetical protein